MKTRLIATLSTLSLAALAGASAKAEDAANELAWQQPGYVMEVVVVTAPRLKAPVAAAETSDATLAWQQPGYIQEVVVATASRSEVLAAAGWHERRAPDFAAWRQPFMGTPSD